MKCFKYYSLGCINIILNASFYPRAINPKFTSIFIFSHFSLLLFSCNEFTFTRTAMHFPTQKEKRGRFLFLSNNSKTKESYTRTSVLLLTWKMKSLFCSYYFVFQFAERKTQNEFEGALAHIHACMRTGRKHTAAACNFLSPALIFVGLGAPHFFPAGKIFQQFYGGKIKVHGTIYAWRRSLAAFRSAMCMKLLGTQTSIPNPSALFFTTMRTGGGAIQMKEKQTSNARLFMVGRLCCMCARTQPLLLEEGRSFKKRNFLSAHVSGNFLLAQVIAQGEHKHWMQP